MSGVGGEGRRGGHSTSALPVADGRWAGQCTEMGPVWAFSDPCQGASVLTYSGASSLQSPEGRGGSMSCRRESLSYLWVGGLPLPAHTQGSMGPTLSARRDPTHAALLVGELDLSFIFNTSCSSLPGGAEGICVPMSQMIPGGRAWRPGSLGAVEEASSGPGDTAGKHRGGLSVAP